MQLLFCATVVHTTYFDLDLRNAHSNVNLANVRHGHFLVLSGFYKDISVSSFLNSVLYLSAFLSRSRSDENIFTDDFFSADVEQEKELESVLESYTGHEDSDIEFDAHVSVEDQLVFSGFFLDNNMCHASILNEYLCFSYDVFYNAITLFYSAICAISVNPFFTTHLCCARIFSICTFFYG